TSDPCQATAGASGVHCALRVFPLTVRRPPSPPLFPYTTLFRSHTPVCDLRRRSQRHEILQRGGRPPAQRGPSGHRSGRAQEALRSEEHTSELQSRENLVCRLLLEKKKRRN